MKPEAELKQLLELLGTLRKEAAQSPIIVEGKKDERSLRALGFDGEIVQLNKGLSLLNFCDELKKRYEKVIILCDWDRTGGKITRKLATYFDSLDMDYDVELRKKLIFLGKKRIKDVEGILSYISDLLRQLRLPCKVGELITRYEDGKILV